MRLFRVDIAVDLDLYFAEILDSSNLTSLPGERRLCSGGAWKYFLDRVGIRLQKQVRRVGRGCASFCCLILCLSAK